jgi:hypothetical protein
MVGLDTFPNAVYHKLLQLSSFTLVAALSVLMTLKHLSLIK